MTGTIKRRDSKPNAKRAARNFSCLLEHVAHLYCAGGSSSISAYGAHELAMSASYALGIIDLAPEGAAAVLDVDDPVALWRDAVVSLEARLNNVLDIWQVVVTLMPPIRNVALRDTLASIGNIRCSYDARFAAHVVPCDIDYQLSKPVDMGLMGLDYIEAWLKQLLAETQWIAQFDADSCTAVLGQVCPDYRGLHVNLYDLLSPHEHELRPRTLFETRPRVF